MILAIDQGTTSTRALVFDERGKPLAQAGRELRQHFPRPGWVEHDMDEIWRAVRECAAEALAGAGLEPKRIAAVGIANQRETLCVWERASGEPLHRAIVWQDRRGADRCQALREAGAEALLRERTGLVCDPYFSATKIEWLLANLPGLRARAERGEALFGTVDSWLAFKLCGEHVSDASNASRTLLMDLERRAFCAELLDLFGAIPERSLPRICGNAEPIGLIAGDALCGVTAPLCGMAGDQQAALFGHGCLRPGEAKSTYGTGAFLLQNTGPRPPAPAPGLLATLAWLIDGSATYALEAAIFTAGACVQWLRDALGLIEKASDSESLAASLDGNDGVYFVPAFNGLGSPHWDAHARGLICGLTGGSGRAHLARAALEAIAYQTVDALDAMAAQSGMALPELRADGGASDNDWLMRFQADMLQMPVRVAAMREATALGAAALAGVGAGLFTPRQWSDLAATAARARFAPAIGAQQREGLLAGWRAALARARSGCA